METHYAVAKCYYGESVRCQRKKYILMDVGKRSSFSINWT